jgi:hypothetical protein
MTTVRRRQTTSARYSGSAIATQSYAELQSTEQHLDQEWYIISLHNEIIGFWDTLILLFVVYTAITLPYTVAFLGDGTTSWTTVVDGVADCLFIVDLIVNFFKSYEGGRGEIVIDPVLIRCPPPLPPHLFLVLPPPFRVLHP